MKVGIIGLTNSGKTTVFNVLTGKSAETSGYSSGSVEPNFGQAVVPDPRFYRLCELFEPKKRTPAAVDFVDVVGLVKGASRGEGLGNQFLSHIRNCDALLHVVRAFDDENVPHPDDSIDPVRDFSTINVELMLADLGAIENRIEKILKKGKVKKESQVEHDLMIRCKECLESEKPLTELTFNDEENILVRGFSFLSLKPQVVVVNVGEDSIADFGNSPLHDELQKQFAQSCLNFPENGALSGDGIAWLAGKLEMEIMELPQTERESFLADYGISDTARDKIIRASYAVLDQFYFFTVGPDEVRAWTVKRNSTAVECASAIHSDIARGFIRAEVIKYEDMVALETMKKLKEKGKFLLEGKEYRPQDGDILHFRFNV
ncbi:MAG: redox-regulated ATPase YchF [Candidatus Wallbacteria bacterium HGW-Wallbacteria-1]|jgi:hypothetical protein|uniref:Ribosome-binding ATPase YchF n=1 Tax=Candidatus Wallbacteria bacterium HGW-Wallbacteria-1 TaxID=2013854 RepID=A0A2N1PQG2_9BACT|nr:MAG: redox-regulated ATPase YchF [Candidatus Wallbacteria bacterium HGW-Wallbacteria-1]